MQGFNSCQEAADLWGISERRVALLAKQGRLEGARKMGGRWMIPVSTEKPADARMKSTTETFADGGALAGKRPMPLGMSDFKRVAKSYHYVDKTLMIRDFLDEQPTVALLLRPEGFGKTLTLSMLRTFFERTDTDYSYLFKDKAIWLCGSKYRAYQGKYPVIALSFKDVETTTWYDAETKIWALIRREFGRHASILSEGGASAYERNYFERVLENSLEKGERSAALSVLTRMLHERYGVAPIVMIDEYDTPVRCGAKSGFYQEVSVFLRNLLRGAFKDNPHLSFGFLAGIQPDSKNGALSGIGSLQAESLFDRRYAQYLGFTMNETADLLSNYGITDVTAVNLKTWFGGYNFGGEEVLNPWSVSGFLNEAQRSGKAADALHPYWHVMDSDGMIGEAIAGAAPEVTVGLGNLMRGEQLRAHVDPCIAHFFRSLGESAVYGLMVAYGYACPSLTDARFDGEWYCSLALPNREAQLLLRKEIFAQLANIVDVSFAAAVRDAVDSGDRAALDNLIGNLARSMM